MTSARPVKVVAIMGAGRSGSTLVDNLLGSIDGFFSGGELRDLWTRGLVERRRCGCGRPIPECDVWSAVLFGCGRHAEPLTSAAPIQIARLQSRLARTRHTPALLRVGPGHAPDGETARLVQVMDALYQRIAAVTGCRVIVDSSKRPSDAALLRLLPNVDPYVVHLVRDPRAVAYSWQRERLEPDAVRPGERMPTRSVMLSTRVWVELNTVGHLVTRRYGSSRSMLLRYEDLVAGPRQAIRGILRLVGEDGEPPIDSGGTAHLRPNHTVGGNPARFVDGPTSIRPDREWRDRLASSDARVCSALTAPLNLCYGYPLRTPRAAATGVVS